MYWNIRNNTVMRILAIIPARGGSKGLERKNILDVAGKPLITWTIEASLKSKYITKTVVSSDDEEILCIAKEYNADILHRPDNISLDITPSEPVIRHALDSLSIEKFDYIVLLQPTSPLRDVTNIDEAISMLLSTEASALISVKAIDNKILKAFKHNKEGYIEGISNNEYPFMRRQDLPKTYLSNGAIYIIAVDIFMKSNSLLTDKTISYLMDDRNSLDIDSVEDLRQAEKYLA